MKPVFRNAMFGFHKEDVFQFITKQNKQFEARIREMNEDKEKVEKDSADRLTALQNELDKVSAELASIGGKSEKLQEAKDNANEIFSAFDTVMSHVCECKQTLLEMKESYRNMQTEAMKANGLRDKAEKFDRLSGVLTSILVGDRSNDKNDAEIEPSLELVQGEGLNDQSFVQLFERLEMLSAQLHQLQEKLELSDYE